MDRSFLDPQLFNKNENYGQKRYKEIVKECWYISDNLNTSYTDVLDMSFQERYYLITFINDKQEQTQKAIEQRQQELRNKRKK